MGVVRLGCVSYNMACERLPFLFPSPPYSPNSYLKRVKYSRRLRAAPRIDVLRSNAYLAMQACHNFSCLAPLQFSSDFGCPLVNCAHGVAYSGKKIYNPKNFIK